MRTVGERAESPRKHSVPIMGYVSSHEEPPALHADGRNPNGLQFSVRAERTVRAISIRAQIPENVPVGAALRLDVNDVRLAEVQALPNVVTLSAAVHIPAGETRVIRIACSSAANPEQTGFSDEERGLGFFLERVLFEHAWHSQPSSYTIIGDSHAARFDGLLLESTGNPNDLIIAKARWMPFSRAYDVFKDGRLNDMITRAFIEARLVKQSDAAQGSPFAPIQMPGNSEPIHLEMQPNAQDAAVLFSYGEVDAWDISHEFFGRSRFDVSPPIEGLERLPDDEGDVEIVDSQTAINRIEERFAPLFAGLRALADFGYKNIFLHDIPPPSTSRREHWKPARLRYKIAVLCNRVCEEFCRSTGTAYISAWNDLTIEGLRNARYDKDGMHVNPESAVISLKKIQRRLAIRDRR
jgi:hypothetical protein